jgi:transposase-like protein
MSQHDDNRRGSIRQHLEGFLKTSSDEVDFVENILEWMLQEVIELEFNEQIGAERYERSDERQVYRNGFRTREPYTGV